MSDISIHSGELPVRNDSNTLHVPLLTDAPSEIEAMHAMAFVRNVYLKLCTAEEFTRAFVWFIDSTEAAIAEKEQGTGDKP